MIEILVGCMTLYGERVEQALVGINRLRPYVDRYVVIVDQTVTEEQKQQLRDAGCEVYFHEWKDDFVLARNHYLDKCQTNDFVIVSDPDEWYNDAFCKDVRRIVQVAEEKGIDRLCINSHDVTFQKEDVEKDVTPKETVSTSFKNLIFRKRLGAMYTGKGEGGRVHEGLEIPGSSDVMMNLDRKYWYTHVKLWHEIWERAARNVFIGGGGINIGGRNPSWKPLREICESLGMDNWIKLREYLRHGNIDPRLKEWLWSNRMEGWDYQHECVTGDTIVHTPDGPIRIDQAINVKYVLGFRDGALVWAKVKRWLKITPRTIYELVTDDGHLLDITEDNLVLTQEGWISTKDLIPSKHYLLVTTYGKEDLDRRRIQDPQRILSKDAGQGHYQIDPETQYKRNLPESFRVETRTQGNVRSSLEQGGGKHLQKELSKDAGFRDTNQVFTSSDNSFTQGKSKKTQAHRCQNSRRSKIHKRKQGTVPTTMGVHSWNNRWRGQYNRNIAEVQRVSKENVSSTRHINLKYLDRFDRVAAVRIRNKFILDNTQEKGSERRDFKTASTDNQSVRTASGELDIGEHFAISSGQEEACGTLVEVYQEEGWENKAVLGLRPGRIGNSTRTEKIELAWRRVIKKTRKDGRDVQRVFDFTTNTGNFFANGILIHNCMEFGRWYFEYLHPEEAAFPDGRVWKAVTEIDPDSPPGLMNFVDQTYQSVLGRNADQQGKEFYTKAILDGQIRKEDLPEILRQSREFMQKVGPKGAPGAPAGETVRVQVPVNVDVRLSQDLFIRALMQSETYWLRIKPRLDIGAFMERALGDQWKPFQEWFYSEGKPSLKQLIKKLREINA